MRDFYEVLGLSRDATQADIKKAYRRLAHRYHPDKNPGNKAAEEQFKEATHAYDILSDPEKRQRYDRFGQTGGPEDFNFGRAGAGFAQNVGDVFSDIFGDFFGRRGGSRNPQERGRDRNLTLAVDFATAVSGGERTVEVSRSQRCQTCEGSGARPGTTLQMCQACGGTGDIRVQQGMFSVNKRCSYCRGRGRIVADPCRDCEGRGAVERRAQLKVKIPPGADQGTVLRYAGEGEAGNNGGQPGDLRVVLEVAAHPVFSRDGADLRCEVPITPLEAMLGGQVEVPTLGGRVRMKVPPGTQHGRVFRLRGKGMPRLGSSAEFGDLHVTVVLEIPQQLSPQAQDLLQQVQRLDDASQYPQRAALWQHFKE